MQTVQLFGGTAGGAQRAAGTAQQSARQLHTLQVHTLCFMLHCYMVLNGGAARFSCAHIRAVAQNNHKIPSEHSQNTRDP